MDAREPISSAGSALAPITLPSNLVWVSDELAVAIVPGDGSPDPYWDLRIPKGEQWVAPQKWAQYDKPCEMCGGHGTIGWHPDYGGAPCDNPDCRDGRQVWEVQWVSYVPGGDIYPNVGGVGPVRLGTLRPVNHTARATLQVVPVTLRPNNVTDDDLPAVWVHPTAGWVKLVMDARTVYHPALDPLPVPGRDFGLIVKVHRVTTDV